MYIRRILGLCGMAVAAILALSSTEASADFLYRFTIPGVKAAPSVIGSGEETPSEEPTGPFGSCKALLDAQPDAASGVHEVEVNGTAFDVYCDMDSHGGGWTLVTAQFEDGQISNWNGGRNGSYDPSLASSASFAFAQGDIPAHSETAFGRGLDATFVDYVDFQYTTGDIAETYVVGKKTDVTFHLYRDANAFIGACDRDQYAPSGAHSGWHNMLSLNPSPNGLYGTNGANLAWCFSTNRASTTESGFYMNGADRNYHSTFAWTVWVR